MIFRTLLLSFLFLPVFAQTLPAKIELSGEDYKAVKLSQRELRNAQLEAENLQLRIEQAQRQLTDLQKRADEERKRWQAMISRLSKVPIEQLSEYTIVEGDGKFTMNRTAPKP